MQDMSFKWNETLTLLASLEKLEQILMAHRIVFQKIVIMPKGQQKKIKGAICNVPVECHHVHLRDLAL